MSNEKRQVKLEEAFQYIDDRFLDLVEEEKGNQKRFAWSTFGKIAACICFLLVLPACAVANNWFGLKELLLQESGKEQTLISLSGYIEGAEAQALAEWEDFLSCYDADGKILAEIGNGSFVAEGREDWALYNVYSYEMGEKLDEIADKYGLKLHTDIEDVPSEKWDSKVGGHFLEEGCKAEWGYMYEDGSFRMEGTAELDGYGTVDFQFGRIVKGTFDGVTLNIGTINSYTERQYHTKQDETVLIALSPYKGLIFADFEECFVAVNVLAGSNEGLTEKNLQELADKIDFEVLKRVQTPDRTGNTAWSENIQVKEAKGYLYGMDGENIPVTVSLLVEDVVSGEAAKQALEENSKVLPGLREGEEYILVTLAVTYVDGGAETLYMAENIGSLSAANLSFSLVDDGSNATNLTAYLDESIYECELKKGETAKGSVAFIHEAGGSSSLVFRGFGTVLDWNIETAATEDGYSMAFYTEAPNQNSFVKAEYPVFSGRKADALNQLIYSKMLSFASLDTSVFSADTGLTAEYESEVTLYNDKMVSVVFWGSSYIEGGAHPTNYLHSVNIDLDTMQEVSFMEMYSANQEFEAVFFEKAYVPTAPKTSYDDIDFAELLKQQTPEYQMFSPFSIEGNVTCFLKPDGIVFSMLTLHTLGDHFEAQMDYSDIEKFYLPEQKYWESKK